MPTDRTQLEALYGHWHHPRYLGTDPLVLARDAPPGDRETAAFLVSCLSLGRASLIVQAGRDLLNRIGSPLAPRLAEARPDTWDTALDGFGYRFFSARRLAAFLGAVGSVLRRHGTLEAAWRSNGARGWDALDAFSALFRSPEVDLGVLVPSEGSQGAAKRLNLFLRWMVRDDDIDLGLWSTLSPAELFMPVDTHILQWARAVGFTSRKTADRKACLEITAALGELSPADPLRYDFAITREGMWNKRTLGKTPSAD